MKYKLAFIFLSLLVSCNKQGSKNVSVKSPTTVVKTEPEKERNSLKFIKILEVSNEFKIAFKEYDSVSWYCDIYVIKENVSHKVVFDEEDLDQETCGFSETYSLSPNGKFIVIERIERGYVEDGKTKNLHENAFCWLINLENFKVIDEFQSACGGEWNDKNEWIYDDEIKFSSN